MTLRAKTRQRLPVVLSQGEVLQLFDHMQDTGLLMARLIYGSGIRLNECLRLRVKDLDFERGCLMVVASKGDKDRQTLLPERLKPDLLAHLDTVRALYETDVKDETLSGVHLPNALERKYPNAGKEWAWQWLFPSRELSVDPRSRKVRRHHIYHTTLQRQVKQAAQKAVTTLAFSFILWKSAVHIITVFEELIHTFFSPDAKKHYSLKSSGNRKPEISDRLSGNSTVLVDFKQHFLNFLPLPHGQGVLRPVFIMHVPSKRIAECP